MLDSSHVTFLLKILQRLPRSLSIKAKVPSIAYKALSFSTISKLITTTLTLAHSAPSPQLLCCSSNNPKVLPPQCLCMFYLLVLGNSSPRYHSLAAFTFLMKCHLLNETSLTILFKVQSSIPPLIVSILLPYFDFPSECSSSTDIQLIYSMVVYLLTLRLKIHESRDFCRLWKLVLF